jgi:hypothetical protein
LLKNKYNHVYLDSHEYKILVYSLIELKNELIQQGVINELLLKVINAPIKKLKVVNI